MRTINEEPRTDEGIGDPETWVNLYADPLFHYALLRTADKAIAEELVQETFVAALSTLSNNRFRGESAGKTFLTITAKVQGEYNEYLFLFQAG